MYRAFLSFWRARFSSACTVPLRARQNALALGLAVALYPASCARGQYRTIAGLRCAGARGARPLCPDIDRSAVARRVRASRGAAACAPLKRDFFVLPARQVYLALRAALSTNIAIRRQNILYLRQGFKSGDAAPARPSVQRESSGGAVWPQQS